MALAFRSPPRVRLTKTFTDPFDNSVATARTCYSSKIITDEDVQKRPKQRDRIAQSIFLAGHHTTLQHAHFQFAIENVSRHALWSFFHAHPFYNSEQVSQRYVEVRPENVLVPVLGDPASQERYEAVIRRQGEAYRDLLELLLPAATELYFQTFPARRKRANDKRWQSSIKKRCQEVARYVLPVGTFAHLYHTISALTLHRYRRLAQQPECPHEQRAIIEAMAAEVKERDPLLFEQLLDPLDLDDTPEAQLLAQHASGADAEHQARLFCEEFDAQLGGLTSRLVAGPTQPAVVLGDAVRGVLGLPKSKLSDEDVMGWLLSPATNSLLGETLNLKTSSKLLRALDLVHFTFRKKISHTADSQAQRHRMTPGARPVLHTHIHDEPDYVTPQLFKHPLAESAKKLFDDVMAQTWADIAALRRRGVDAEAWQYLLPNAVSVRFVDTGSLAHHHHRWSSRLCYNAQEEIWNAVVDEVRQVRAQHPAIGEFLLPPCGMRKLAGTSPVCPEGDRYCGVRVWTQSVEEYTRLL